MKLDYIKITNRNGGIMHGGNQSFFSKNIKRSGCGMIAACDMVLYKQNRKTLGIDEYKQFVAEKSVFFYRFHINLIGVTAFRIVRFLRKHSFSFRFVPSRKLNGERFEKLVKASIENGNPVIVRVGLNGNKLPYNVFHSDSGKYSHGTLSWHYITVTGFENDRFFYSSWGGTGEISITDLRDHLGFMGGIICSQ
ncbi:MAG: hypothetical protein IJZ61_00800 [Oscillospiraceae bacterium]|nr:hypothetical protein [Oscillospiraceae bacterium]